jgi:hypothetical protein
MKTWAILAAALATAALAGCQKNTAGDEWALGRPTGRYAGIGVYPAGSQWSRIAVSGQPADAAAARTIDDEHVIVVVDSKTGEVRQCGNLSGYCIGMNPWSKPLAAAQDEPVPVTQHASSTPGDAAMAESAAPAVSDTAERPRRHHRVPASGLAPTATP